MKQTIKQRLYSAAAVVAVVGVALSPVVASAATDTTTVNVNVGSTISITSGPSVDMDIIPTAGGSQSNDVDVVTVNSNNATGYTLTFSDADTNSDLVGSGNVINPHAGTFAVPTALAADSWGYAVPGETDDLETNTFDATYTPFDDQASSTSKWAGVPPSGSPQTVRVTAGIADGDITNFWYSAKVTTAKPNGLYTDTVLYTAVVN